MDCTWRLDLIESRIGLDLGTFSLLSSRLLLLYIAFTTIFLRSSAIIDGNDEDVLLYHDSKVLAMEKLFSLIIIYVFTGKLLLLQQETTL